MSSRLALFIWIGVLVLGFIFRKPIKTQFGKAFPAFRIDGVYGITLIFITIFVGYFASWDTIFPPGPPMPRGSDRYIVLLVTDIRTFVVLFIVWIFFVVRKSKAMANPMAGDRSGQTPMFLTALIERGIAPFGGGSETGGSETPTDDRAAKGRFADGLGRIADQTSRIIDKLVVLWGLGALLAITMGMIILGVLILSNLSAFTSVFTETAPDASTGYRLPESWTNPLIWSGLLVVVMAPAYVRAVLNLRRDFMRQSGAFMRQSSVPVRQSRLSVRQKRGAFRSDPTDDGAPSRAQGASPAGPAARTGIALSRSALWAILATFFLLLGIGTFENITAGLTLTYYRERGEGATPPEFQELMDTLWESGHQAIESMGLVMGIGALAIILIFVVGGIILGIYFACRAFKSAAKR